MDDASAHQAQPDRAGLALPRVEVLRPGGVLEVFAAQGDGPLVVLLPSLGRSAGDVAALVAALTGAGRAVAVVQPRGIGGSTAPLAGLSMTTLADDVIARPENTGHLRRHARARVEVATVPDAGHALLPEQPDLVADLVLGWLRRRHPGR